MREDSTLVSIYEGTQFDLGIMGSKFNDLLLSERDHCSKKDQSLGKSWGMPLGHFPIAMSVCVCVGWEGQ